MRTETGTKKPILVFLSGVLAPEARKKRGVGVPIGGIGP